MNTNPTKGISSLLLLSKFNIQQTLYIIYSPSPFYGQIQYEMK